MDEGRRKKPRGRPRRSAEASLAGCRHLNRNSEVPLYFQLAATLFEQLEIGNWHEGDRFATERELEDHFDVSRSVVRRALELLVGDGAILRTQGSGAVLAPPRFAVPIFGLLRVSMGAPANASASVRTSEGIHPDLAVAKFLQLERHSERILHVTAVLELDGEPIGIAVSYIPTGKIPGLAGAIQALHSPDTSTLDIELSRADVLVEHTHLGRWEAPQVGATAWDPALMVRLIQYGRQGGAKKEQPVEFARLIYRSDRTQLIL